MEFFNKWAVIFMRDLMADFKLSALDAAAIIGNAGHESNGFRDLQEKKPLIKGSKGGYGIMQWTGPRRREYEAYCQRNKFNPADMVSNYKFLFVELKGPEGKVLPLIVKADTLNTKTKVFSETFLRPGIPHMESRYVWASRAMDAWAKAKPAEKVVTADPGELGENPIKSKTVLTWLGTVVLTWITALGHLDWKVQMAIVAVITGFGGYGIKRRYDLFREVKNLKKVWDE